MNEIMTQPGGRGEAADFLTPGGRIVVGVDSSPASKVALRAAARMAALTEATIDALTVWDYPVSYIAYGYAQGLDPQAGGWDPENDARRMLEATVDEVFGANRPAGLQTVLLRGNAAKQIVQHAEGASLIVLGSRGNGGFAGLMLGSKSMRVAAAARCPVLIIHPPADGSPADDASMPMEAALHDEQTEMTRVPLGSVLRPPRR
jgi:nucleotide-binding universal stress UspA family protein